MKKFLSVFSAVAFLLVFAVLVCPSATGPPAVATVDCDFNFVSSNPITITSTTPATTNLTLADNDMNSAMDTSATAYAIDGARIGSNPNFILADDNQIPAQDKSAIAFDGARVGQNNDGYIYYAMKLRPGHSGVGPSVKDCAYHIRI